MDFDERDRTKNKEKPFGRLVDRLGKIHKSSESHRTDERGEGCGIGCLFSLIGILGIPFGVLSNLTKRYGGRR